MVRTVGLGKFGAFGRDIARQSVDGYGTPVERHRPVGGDMDTEAVPGSADPEVLVVKLQSIIIPATTGMAAPKRTNANRRLVNCVIMANRFFVSE